MHADALIDLRARPARALRRIANDLEVRVAARLHRGVEVLERLAEAECERAQHREAHPIHRTHPLEYRRPHRGQTRGPLIRTAHAKPRRIAGGYRHRGLLHAEIELLAPIARALRDLVTEHRVAAKVRRARDRERLALGF